MSAVTTHGEYHPLRDTDPTYSRCLTMPTPQVKLGLNLSVAMGPVGRQIEGTGVAGGKGSAACYAYAVSRGAFAGVALDGTVRVVVVLVLVLIG